LAECLDHEHHKAVENVEIENHYLRPSIKSSGPRHKNVMQSDRKPPRIFKLCVQHFPGRISPENVVMMEVTLRTHKYAFALFNSATAVVAFERKMF
jgi:hypothetical protein